MQPSTNQPGKVYLVGAGPGDPGLITVRGLHCLQRADLVLYDGLVNPLLLRHTQGKVERTARTATCGSGQVPQSSVNEMMVAAARAGQTVVRLKGGDPFVFGRGGEEAEPLTAAGIPFEIVPGITAATAAAVCTGISLTHRDYASAVALVTGHEDPSKTQSSLDYDVLAKFPGTLVFYMGLHRVLSIVEGLMNAGMDPATPATVVCQTTLPQQRMVSGTLATIAAGVAEAGLHPPSLILIGETVAHRESVGWFERRPLHGVSIGLTRSEEQLDGVIDRVVELGGEPVLMPLIQICPPENWTAADAMLSRLGEFDWTIFTSTNGVNSLMQRLWETGGDARRFSKAKFAAIGPATADSLAKYSLRADVVPEVYRAEQLAEALAPHVRGKRVLWVRASRGRDVLPARLKEAGAFLEEVVVYRNLDVDSLDHGHIERIDSGRLDWIGLSSPSIARSLARLISQAGIEPDWNRVRLAAISPVTAEAAVSSGLAVSAVASEFTWDGLLSAMAQAGRQRA